MTDAPLRDADILTLCAFEEANLEPLEGLAAIPRVVLNRMAKRYMSDGTVAGTVFRHDQFSWTGWAMKGGKYTEVARTPAEVMARAKTLLLADEAYSKRWAEVAAVVAQVCAGKFHGPLFDQITPEVVLYLNPAICHATWATPGQQVVRIGHHDFFRAPP
jgi:spore germination cell wall hydrolase CwlJ-like protein